MTITASELCKDCGLKSLKELSEMTHTSLSSLHWMYKNNRAKFNCLLVGAGRLKLIGNQGSYTMQAYVEL